MTSNDSLSILACQLNVPPTRTSTDRDQHLSQMREKISSALSRDPADLVLLPELCSIEYSRDAFSRLPDLSEPLSGPSFQQWRCVSREFNCHVAFSFARTDSDDNFYITLAVVNPDGVLVGHYDKVFLAQFGASMEKEYFTAGEHLLSFDINGFTFGTIICADIRFPELSRTLTVEREADVILHSGAYFRDASFYSWHHFAHTRALENQVYLVSLNRAGDDYGHSIFVPPWVDEARKPTLFSQHDEQLMRLQISRSELNDVRSLYPFLADRRQW